MKIPKIQTRTDYESFAFMNGNRPLNLKKIEKIKEDILNGLNLLPYCPVIVFEKDGILHLVDGQHRFKAAEDLNLPVHYVISEELNLFQIATMNSKQDKWKEGDFLKCYIELGIPDYATLKSISEEFKIGIAIVAELLQHGNYLRRKEILDQFREGHFRSNFENEAREMLVLVNSLFQRYTFYSDRNLYLAVQMLKDKGLCDFDFLKEKIKQAPVMMDKQSTYKEYIYNIERVYNHKATNRKVIF